MDNKIVFNGQEFDGVEAMPADVRKQYDDVMRLLADSGQAPAGGMDAIRKIVNLKTSFRTRIVVNNKEYHADELPVELRAVYDRAVGSGGGELTPGGRPGVSLPVRQILWFLLGGLLVAWWFLYRR